MEIFVPLLNQRDDLIQNWGGNTLISIPLFFVCQFCDSRHFFT